MATREQIYTEQLKALGIYDKAFDPEIKTLAQLERELTRAQKEWKKTAKEDEAPSVRDPAYAVITGIRREILSHRDALGLTPKALRKLKGAASPAGPNAQEVLTELLDGLREQANG